MAKDVVVVSVVEAVMVGRVAKQEASFPQVVLSPLVVVLQQRLVAGA